MNYQFGFYGPGTHLDANPETIAKLLGALNDKGLIPTTISELLLTPSLKARAQLRFMSPDEEWLLAFESKRVLLRKQSLPKTDIGDAKAFCNEAIEIFARLLDTVPIKGNRLSYVVNGLFPECSDEEFIAMKSRVLGDIPFYVSNRPNRWDTKCVCRVERDFGNKSEILNVLTDINRVQGEFNDGDGGKIPFDRIEVEVDINTTQDNLIARFDNTDIDPFLNEAIQMSDKLVSEVGEFLNV